MVTHRERIDELISTYSVGWTIDRMPAVDREVLRLGVFELLWSDEVPDAVVLTEAVNLARDLSTDESPAFVNGVLARLLDNKPALAVLSGSAASLGSRDRASIELRAAAAARCRPGTWSPTPASLDAYRRDEAQLVSPGTPLAVVLAHSRDDVVAACGWATAHRVPVVPRGAGTGLAGGATATDGCVVLSLAKMNAIIELNAGDQLAVVEPGVINADLNRAAAAHGLMFAPDPSSFESSTIGGNIATNAGGLRCVKYGVTRESVLGLEVVLADGRVLKTGRRTVKGVAGYDLTSLFVGSEGTLGIITQATVRLSPRPATDPVTVVGVFASFAEAG